MKKKSFLSILLCGILIVLTSQCFAENSVKSDKQQVRKYADVINQLYYYIQNNYVEEVDPEKLYEGAIKGMLESLDDPYSSYLDKSAWRSLSDTTVGNFGGVGLSITKPTENTPEKPAYVEVASPIDNSPGARAGIQSGDLIIKIEDVDTSTITMEEVLSMLRGTVGESVTITVRRKNYEFTKTLVRAVIENPTVKSALIGDIGYIQLTEFSTNTTKRMQEALDSFEQQGYKGLIIDLRNNGGGLLSTAVDIADKFIDEGVIVSTKSRLTYENSVYHANKKNTVVRGIPIVVLINRASASASEILSGALKDTKKAYLIGENSYGKGSVQIPSGLVANDGFKITVARYYSPTDVNIDKVGIAPDMEVLFPDFSDEEAEAFSAIMGSTEISDYVEMHPNMTEKEIASYAKELSKKYNLEQRVLRKLIRNETDRTKPSRIYDLDYDIQLDTAIDFIKTCGDFEKVMAQTKTLKELQDQKAE